MSRVHRFKEWMTYRRKALSRHSVHSPFVYLFMENALKKHGTDLEQRVTEYFKGYDIRREQWELPETISDNTLLLLRNIHHSKTASLKWETLFADPRVTLSIDLYHLGLLFFKKDFREKQHFILKQ